MQSESNNMRIAPQVLTQNELSEMFTPIPQSRPIEGEERVCFNRAGRFYRNGRRIVWYKLGSERQCLFGSAKQAISFMKRLREDGVQELPYF